MLLYVRFCLSLSGRSESEEPRHDA
jgi:hypothetical protein